MPMPAHKEDNYRPVIHEVIVVEGKDDVAAVKRACQAQTIITSGLGISRNTLRDIQIAQQHCGVIILTDPDAPGEKIRHIINQNVPGCKQARLHRKRKDNRQPVGVEYATPEEILEALHEAKMVEATPTDRFSLADLIELDLVGGDGAKAKRDWLSRRLGIGMPNGKQFLRRLNDYNVSHMDFMDAYQELISQDDRAE